MKKRMIAILLSLTILCSSMFCTKRASAAAAITGGFSIFLVAWEMLDLMTKGEVPGFVQVIQWCGERVAEGAVLTWEFFTDPDGAFQQAWGDFWDNWAAGYETICDYLDTGVDVSNLFDANGNLKLTYEEYYEMYRQTVDVMSKSGINFQAGYDYTFLSLDLNSVVFLRDLPTMSQFYQSSSYESYCPVYFNSDKVVFSNRYLKFGPLSLSIPFIHSSYSEGMGWNFYAHNSAFINEYSFSFSDFPGINVFYLYSGDDSAGSLKSSSSCFIFENNRLSFQDISSVDLSGMSSGLITTTGNFVSFLRSLQGFSSSVGNVDKLDDLSSALPTDKNPSLTFPELPIFLFPIILKPLPFLPLLPLLYLINFRFVYLMIWYAFLVFSPPILFLPCFIFLSVLTPKTLHNGQIMKLLGNMSRPMILCSRSTRRSLSILLTFHLFSLSVIPVSLLGL